MTDIFISYSTKEADFAYKMCDLFEKAGLSCWIAPRNIHAGEEYGGEIIRGIEGSRVFFLCLSESANESQHVLREVERAVNRNMSIVVYQGEEVALSKSMEYFLAPTQWFIPDKDHGDKELVEVMQNLLCKENCSEKAEEIGKTEENKAGQKKKSRKWLWFVDLIAVLIIAAGILFFVFRDSKDVEMGDVFTYGSLDLTGSSKESLEWLVLDVNEEEKTVLCITQNIVAFFPYDGAESGKRGQSGEIYFNENHLDKYSDEQLVDFWGSSEWKSANIRSWLNSDSAIVRYEGTAPSENTTSLYENDYETMAGFLYGFSKEEREKLVSTELEDAGTTDKVFLLSREEAEKYFIGQNILIPATPTENAVLLEGTGIYKEYYDDGERSTYWGLRSRAENACSIWCVGTGLGKTEIFHSEYACSSLLGVRPAIVLPLDYVKTLK